MPVIVDEHGGLHGVEAVIDKDLAAAMLATELGADALLLLTDVSAIQTDWGTPSARELRSVTVSELAALDLPAGSMGPKATGRGTVRRRDRRDRGDRRPADAGAILEGRAGTRVVGDDGGTVDLVRSSSGHQMSKEHEMSSAIQNPAGVAGEHRRNFSHLAVGIDGFDEGHDAAALGHALATAMGAELLLTAVILDPVVVLPEEMSLSVAAQGGRAGRAPRAWRIRSRGQGDGRERSVRGARTRARRPPRAP